MRLFIQYISTFLLLMLIFQTPGYAFLNISLAENKIAKSTIVLPPNPSETLKYASTELAKYLNKISGAVFTVTKSSKIEQSSIYLKLTAEKGKEKYSISSDNGNIILSGNEDRTVLYAVYDFLARLGCRWVAPEFSFYKGYAEFVPYKPKLVYDNSNTVVESPVFTYRKLDVEEGLSHTAENLKQIIEWMPKLRFNTLMFPSDYQGTGRVKWDNWRKDLIPELKKRGLLIEVGGHGHQNFINPEMENGTLFNKHPEWFGKNKHCQPDKDDKLVFNTANKEAVNYFINNILKYLNEHPEVDIFDLWPPDSGKWAECEQTSALGSPEERLAILLNQVNEALKQNGLTVKLQMIAYAKTLLPPKNTSINKDILVDFCPIDQNFESQIYDSQSVSNTKYAGALQSWRSSFIGDIGLYSYFRKYAWKSLPNVIPHYIQNDMLWYAKVPLQGILTYAEPGDWYTYELNHYVLGQLGWNPKVEIDSIIIGYCKIRYGRDWKVAQTAYDLLENTVRFFGGIRFSSIKPEEDISNALDKIKNQISIINELSSQSSKPSSATFNRLLLMLEYARIDLNIRKALAINKSEITVTAMTEDIFKLFKKNKSKGTFVFTGRENSGTFIKNYLRKE